jgi:hypothetical protein
LWSCEGALVRLWLSEGALDRCLRLHDYRHSTLSQDYPEAEKRLTE